MSALATVTRKSFNDKFILQKLIFRSSPGGGTRMARGGIRLVLHGLTNSTLIMYYSGMKKDPKYAFLLAFFFICLSCAFQNLSIWPKSHPFSNFARFCTPKQCTRVQCLLLKNNPNYVNFWTSMIPPLTFEWPPGDRVFYVTMLSEVLKSLHTLFDTYLDHVLVKFKQNPMVVMVRNRNFKGFDKKCLIIFGKALMSFWKTFQ